MRGEKFAISAVLMVAFLVIGPVVWSETTDGVNVKFQLSSGVSLDELRWYLKDYEGKKRLHIELVIKNLTNEPKRFNVKLKLHDTGQSVGAFVPRKGKKGQPAVIEPGKTGKTILPMLYEQMPKSISLAIGQ